MKIGQQAHTGEEGRLVSGYGAKPTESGANIGLNESEVRVRTHQLFRGGGGRVARGTDGYQGAFSSDDRDHRGVGGVRVQAVRVAGQPNATPREECSGLPGLTLTISHPLLV